jgi:hypothetical protein
MPLPFGEAKRLWGLDGAQVGANGSDRPLDRWLTSHRCAMAMIGGGIRGRRGGGEVRFWPRKAKSSAIGSGRRKADVAPIRSDLAGGRPRRPRAPPARRRQYQRVGGRNIANEYFGAGSGIGFADIDVLVVGPAVRDVSKEFDLYWNSASAYPAAGFVGAPGPDAVATLQEKFLAPRHLPRSRIHLRALAPPPSAGSLPASDDQNDRPSRFRLLIGGESRRRIVPLPRRSRLAFASPCIRCPRRPPGACRRDRRARM